VGAVNLNRRLDDLDRRYGGAGKQNPRAFLDAVDALLPDQREAYEAELLAAVEHTESNEEVRAYIGEHCPTITKLLQEARSSGPSDRWEVQ
jgi:hypothetical protein